MEICTSYKPNEKYAFERYKRRSRGKWQFVASGEWSQSAYHQGNHAFHIRSDSNNKYWSLLSVGFPNRIIAAAYTPELQALELVAVAMLRAVREDDGDYIDTLDATGKVDRVRFWKDYLER